jgi:EAL domain-containing protein (putative c-di-GMP-specific phosphodiesterase class I)
VAEFVSSKEVYEATKNLGIDYMQGYHFGKPMPKEDI